MIPYDTKHYRSSQPGILSKIILPAIGVIVLVALLSWMDKRDRASHVKAVQQATAAQCM